MEIVKLICGHCGTLNSVGTCNNCDRSFVITDTHLQSKPREFDSDAVASIPENISINLCDFCTAKAEGKIMEAVLLGMRQRTCPSCHIEFLSQHER